MQSSYSIPLVVLSYIVAVLASHVTLSLAQRLHPTYAARLGHKPLYLPWIVGGAFSMGTGIWSMHFIGMLAFSLPVPMGYDVPVTLLSMLIAIVVSGFALRTVSRDSMGLRHLVLGAVLMGIGVLSSSLVVGLLTRRPAAAVSALLLQAGLIAGIPAGTGDITLFNPPSSTDSRAIDVSATISDLRTTCQDSGNDVISTATFTVVALRRDAGPARQVVLPYFNVALRGGSQIAAKQVGQVVLNFAAGDLHGWARVQATVRVNRGAATLPANVRAILTRPRKAGEAEAAVGGGL